jgi:regulation of enolase protein 1 (concanavalin A-like superfamily)
VNLQWLGRPGLHASETSGTIGFGAGPRTDWFHDPRTGAVTTSAPVAVVTTGDGPVTLSCHVATELVATFDAAGLLVHYDDEHWVKLALELSPAGEPTVVTVRTATASDDCNHRLVTGSTCWFRASVDERSVAFHVSDDASSWQLVRYCAPPLTAAPTIGLLVQSPTGEGTTGTFDSLVVEPRSVLHLRDGS